MQMAVTKSRQLPEVRLSTLCLPTHLPYSREGAFNSALLAVSPSPAVHNTNPSGQGCCKAVRYAGDGLDTAWVAGAPLCYAEPQGGSVLEKWGSLLPAVKESQ